MNVAEFKLRNQTKTSNATSGRCRTGRTEMVNDPGPIRELAQKLDDLTTAVIQSGRFEDLREICVRAGNLSPIVTSI